MPRWDYLPRIGNDQRRLTESGRPSRAAEGLTWREDSIVRLIARGKSNKEIATDLGIQASTVKVYVSRMLDKMGFESRYQVMAWGLRNIQEDPNDLYAMHLAGLGYREGAD